LRDADPVLDTAAVKALEARYGMRIPGWVPPATMHRYYKKHEGERCFIIGNGPSLNKHDLSKLKDEWLFGCNQIYLKREKMGRSVDYYFLVDSIVVPQLFREANRYLAEGQTEAVFVFKGDGHYIMHPNVFESDWCRFLNYFSNTAPLMIRIAMLMGFDPIYLIGVDMNYDGLVGSSEKVSNGIYRLMGDDKWHFDSRCLEAPDGRPIEYVFLDNEMEAAFGAFDRINELAITYGCRVLNAGVDSRLDVFKKVDYDSLFD